MIRLPSPDSHALAGFGVALGACCGGCAAALVWLAAGALPAAAAGVCIAMGLGLPAWRSPHIMATPYGVWNRVANRFGNSATAWTLWVCHRVVFTGVGRCGTRLRLQAPAEGASMWVARHTLDPATYSSPSDRRLPSRSRGGWLGGFRHWATTPQNAWGLALLPFLLVLRALASRGRTAAPADIYTLY